MKNSPYWSDIEGMKKYILDRVADRPVPPPIGMARAKGEEPYMLVADWIHHDTYPEMRQVYIDLSNDKLREVNLAELLGLLKVGIRNRDSSATEVVLSWAFPSQELSEEFLLLHTAGYQYDSVGYNVIKLVDLTTDDSSFDFYRALISETPNLGTAKSCICPLLKRQRKNEGEQSVLAVKERFQKQYSGFEQFVNRALEEIRSRSASD